MLSMSSISLWHNVIEMSDTSDITDMTDMDDVQGWWWPALEIHAQLNGTDATHPPGGTRRARYGNMHDTEIYSTMQNVRL
jgi:hypothetical protein